MGDGKQDDMMHRVFFVSFLGWQNSILAVLSNAKRRFSRARHHGAVMPR